MSDISSTGSIGSAIDYLRQKRVGKLSKDLFKKIDTGGDGSVGQAEMEKAVTGAGGTQSSADALSSALDPTNTGGVNQSQFLSGFQALAFSPTNGAQLISAQAQSSAGADPAAGLKQNLFSQIDANGDGVLTKDELEKAVTAAGGTSGQADALYAKLDPNGTGSVTEQQFTQAVPKHHHMHGGHHAPPPDDDTDTADSATGAAADLDSAIDALLKNLAPGQQPPAMAAAAATDGTPSATAASADATTAANDPVKQLEDAIQALLNGATTGQGTSGSAMMDATTAMFRSLFNPNMSSPMMTTLIDLQGAGGAAA